MANGGCFRSGGVIVVLGMSDGGVRVMIDIGNCEGSSGNESGDSGKLIDSTGEVRGVGTDSLASFNFVEGSEVDEDLISLMLAMCGYIDSGIVMWSNAGSFEGHLLSNLSLLKSLVVVYEIKCHFCPCFVVMLKLCLINPFDL